MSKGITRNRIVAAALGLLNEKGMDGLTVRALATRLDVRPSALYWHVRNKRDLLDEMSTAVMRRVGSALSELSPGDGWRDDLIAFASVLRAEFLLHRDGARIFSGARIADHEVVQAKEYWFVRWTASGIDLSDADDAVDLVVAFVVGFVIEEQEHLQSAEADPTRYSLTERDAWLGGDAPLVKRAGHLQDHGDQRFERHLGIVLDGLATRLKV